MKRQTLRGGHAPGTGSRLATWILLALGSWLASGQPPTGFWSGPEAGVDRDRPGLLTLHVLNDAAQGGDVSFPPVLPCRLITTGRTTNSELKRIQPDQASAVQVPPHGFVRATYELATAGLAAGHWIVEIQGAWPGLAVLSLDAAAPTVAAAPAGTESRPEENQPAPQPVLPSDPVAFFKEHFYPHDPMYFIAGTESPNAKFQISLKYQIFTSQGRLARRLPEVQNLYLGYTQTSLWDLDQVSSPFYDSSYKPEFLYASEWIKRGERTRRFGLRFQGGLQHESNGRDGASSRSLNILYVKPTFTFGPQDGFQVIVMPRAWVYVGGLDDNPDLPDYRGYTDLRVVLGWNEYLQLSAWGRAGDSFDYGSLQLDLTYPLWKIPLLRSSLFLQVQYFTGYGESLIDYDERSDAFRAGFALFR